MKKALLFFQPFLSEFKWYRKLVGGTWYKIYDSQSDFGMAGDASNWTQKPKENVEVIKDENYNSF